MAKAAKAAKVAMLNARDVLRQTQGGRVPPFWRMYRWRRRGDVRRVSLSAVYLVLLALLGLETGAIAYISDPETLGTIRQRIDGAPAVVLACCALAGLVAALLALTPLAVGAQAFLSLLLPAALRPVLVMLPEGCVERTGTLVHRVRVVAYADIGQIELRVRHHRPTGFDRAAHRLTFAERTSVSLNLYHWNGSRKSWPLRADFGQPALLAQAIIAAHGQYANNVSARRARVRPGATPERR